MRVTKVTFVFVLIAIAFFSCKKSKENTNWDVDVVAPIVNSSLDINNLITDTLLVQNPDSSLKLVFDANLYEFKVDSFLKLPDTVIKYPFTLGNPFPYTLVPGDPIYTNKLVETKYNTGGAELATMTFKSGNLRLYVENDYRIPVKLVYKINSAKKNNQVFVQNIIVPAAPDTLTPGIYDTEFDLSDYTLDFKGTTGTKFNTVSTTFSIYLCDTITCPGYGYTVVYYPDSIKVRNYLTDVVPAYARGYFGKQTIDLGPYETAFDAFKSIKGGVMKVQDTKVNFLISNGIGVDARITMNELKGINTNTNNTVSLTGSLIGAAQNINRATETGNNATPVNYMNKNIQINSGNSNIDDVIGNLPSKLNYSLRIITNPLGNLSGSNDFVYYGNGIKALMNMEVPLNINTKDLTLEDTVDVDLSELKDKTRINRGEFNLHVNNGFPFDATVQIYLLNENNQIVDSLFSAQGNVALAANLNSSNKVESKKLTILKIVVDKDRLFNLFSAKQMIVKSKFTTASYPSLIKLYSNYNIDFKLIGDFNYNVQLKR